MNTNTHTFICKSEKMDMTPMLCKYTNMKNTLNVNLSLYLGQSCSHFIYHEYPWKGMPPNILHPIVGK